MDANLSIRISKGLGRSTNARLLPAARKFMTIHWANLFADGSPRSRNRFQL